MYPFPSVAFSSTASSNTTLRNASNPRSVPTIFLFPLRVNLNFLSYVDCMDMEYWLEGLFCYLVGIEEYFIIESSSERRMNWDFIIWTTDQERYGGHRDMHHVLVTHHGSWCFRLPWIFWDQVLSRVSVPWFLIFNFERERWQQWLQLHKLTNLYVQCVMITSTVGCRLFALPGLPGPRLFVPSKRW